MPSKPISRRFADTLIRLRWVVVAIWVAGVGALVILVGPVAPVADDTVSFLPKHLPSQRAAAALAKHFPHNSSPTEAVMVFERRDGPLKDADREAIERIADELPRPQPPHSTDADLKGVHVRSPLMLPISPMISPVSDAGQAALIIINIPANFITVRSARVVGHVRRVLDRQKRRPDWPAGLGAAVTGSGAYGYDYAEAAERSHRRTLFVTLVAVVLILLLIYRAPIAAVIPLAAISLAAVAALKLLAMASHFGLHTGMAERIFVVVLLYGAGIDYSMLLISRCREFLDVHRDGPLAAAAGLETSLPAILASAGTDTAGLLMLSFAKFAIFRTTGLAVALALVVALLSAVTLVPALVSIAGGRLFWPSWNPARARPRRKRLWSRLAGVVTRRPGVVMAVTVAALVVPAVQGTRLPWVFDTLTALSEEYPAVRGRQMVKRHWPIGEIAPVDVLIDADADPPLSIRQWQQVAWGVSARLRETDGVSNVRSLTQPLGTYAGSARPNALSDTFHRLIVKPLASLLQSGSSLVQDRVRKEYVSPDRRVCRMEVITAYRGQSLEALAALPRIRRAIEAALADAPTEAKTRGTRPRFTVHLAGITAETIDKRGVTHGDFTRIAGLVLGVIFLMVFLLLRDVILSAFMVASTVLSYLATLGISYWFCLTVLHCDGLDWKVEIFLFVVMVAVGQDYNIFLAARLAQEGLHYPCAEATRRAVIHTGPVISSCGIIMAATLGSLMAGRDLLLLVQLGFALALGMLIDSFVVRPLLLPAFAVLTGRTGRSFRIHG